MSQPCAGAIIQTIKKGGKALGEDNVMIRFGIMGAGKIARKFADAVTQVEGAQVTAVASKSLERAKAFAQEEGVEHYYGSYEEMLTQGEVDAVYIATTMNFHYENILQCLEHGKHVMCEKCMVLTAQQAREVCALAKEKGLFLMECMWVLFLPKMQKVKEWIEGGKIGKLKMAQGTLGFHAPFDPQSRLYSPELGGGAMYDVGVYLIEVLGHFAKENLSQVQAQVYRGPTGVDEAVSFHLRYGDYLVNGQCSVSTVLPENAYFYGEEGYIELDWLHFGHRVRLYGNDRAVKEEYVQEDVNGFIYQVKEAVRCIEAGLLESDTVPHKMTIQCCEIFDQCLGTGEALYR